MEKVENIPLVILAGGKGTRISEYTHTIPKPMIKIGKKPIIKHIIDYYKFYGVKNFFIASGYKQKYIKQYFKKDSSVNVIFTGSNSMTGGRLLRLKKYLKSTFFLTYGDGLSDINITKLYQYHLIKKKIATVTAVHPVARFGEVKFNNDKITSFNEKPRVKNDWINGGFFVFEKEIFSFLNNDMTILENQPLRSLVKKKQLNGFKHDGFWQCMDTVRERVILENLYKSDNCPWKIK